MSHKCPARHCDVIIPDALLFCRADWYRVPRLLRAEVTRAYAGGRGLGSGELRHAQAAAIRAVNGETGQEP